jgi:hypothetical protein
LLAVVAVLVGLAIAAAMDALDASTLAVLATVAVAAFLLSRGFAKAHAPASQSAQRYEQEESR